MGTFFPSWLSFITKHILRYNFKIININFYTINEQISITTIIIIICLRYNQQQLLLTSPAESRFKRPTIKKNSQEIPKRNKGKTQYNKYIKGVMNLKLHNSSGQTSPVASGRHRRLRSRAFAKFQRNSKRILYIIPYFDKHCKQVKFIFYYIKVLLLDSVHVINILCRISYNKIRGTEIKLIRDFFI